MTPRSTTLAYREPSVARDLDAYFKSGVVVCPFARTARLVFQDDGDLHAAVLRSKFRAISAGFVLVVHATVPRATWDEAREWARRMFGRLRAAMIELLGVPEDGALALDDLQDEPLRPHLSVNDVTFYVTGMGPQYPSRHPRHAPHLCLVLVDEVAIRMVPHRERLPIHQAMFERAGVAYDPDEVWLSLKPKPRGE